MKRIYFSLCLVFPLLVACSGSNNDSNVFETQVESIDKAKEVEDQILKAAQAQREAINSATE